MVLNLASARTASAGGAMGVLRRRRWSPELRLKMDSATWRTPGFRGRRASRSGSRTATSGAGDTADGALYPPAIAAWSSPTAASSASAVSSSPEHSSGLRERARHRRGARAGVGSRPRDRKKAAVGLAAPPSADGTEVQARKAPEAPQADGAGRKPAERRGGVTPSLSCIWGKKKKKKKKNKDRARGPEDATPVNEAAQLPARSPSTLQRWASGADHPAPGGPSDTDGPPPRPWWWARNARARTIRRGAAPTPCARGGWLR